jgi:hypothetical protein
MASFLFPTLWLWLLLPRVAYGQSVQPSNATFPTSAMTQMSLSGGPISVQQSPSNIVPLTAEAGKGSNNPVQLTVSAIPLHAIPPGSRYPAHEGYRYLYLFEKLLTLSRLLARSLSRHLERGRPADFYELDGHGYCVYKL